MRFGFKGKGRDIFFSLWFKTFLEEKKFALMVVINYLESLLMRVVLRFYLFME